MVKINYLIIMKKWLVPVGLLVISSCKNDNPEPQVNVIMPLGASRVQGSPAYLSYRYDLWKKLRLNGYNIDFIGGEVTVRFTLLSMKRNLILTMRVIAAGHQVNFLRIFPIGPRE